MPARDEQSVTFRWKDRAGGGADATRTLPGVEFARRFLRHALPAGLRAIRYFGWCHPAAKKTRDRIRLRTGLPVEIKGTVGLRPQPELRVNDPRRCPQCRTIMERLDLDQRTLMHCRNQWIRQMSTGPP
jgi:hypothetical protein